MKAAIRYYTRGGNTEKLALAISKATGLPAETIDVPLLDVKVGKVVNFSTACLVKSTYKQVGKLLAEKNIPLAKEEYYCRGSFGPMHKGRPNQQDLQAAEAFARKIMEG